MKSAFFGLTALLTTACAVLIGVGSYTFFYARGTSYLTDDPAACRNCHVMEDHYQRWQKSIHRSLICNDCHLPNNPVGKYLAKADNGFRHSYAFTFADVQALRTHPRNEKILAANCIACHGEMIMVNNAGMDKKNNLSCLHCHQGVGHAR